MSDATLLSIGALLFLATATVTVMYGIRIFQLWYDRDHAEEIERRLETPGSRDPHLISHDHPERLADLSGVPEAPDGPLVRAGTDTSS